MSGRLPRRVEKKCSSIASSSSAGMIGAPHLRESRSLLSSRPPESRLRRQIVGVVLVVLCVQRFPARTNGVPPPYWYKGTPAGVPVKMPEGMLPAALADVLGKHYRAAGVGFRLPCVNGAFVHPACGGYTSDRVGSGAILHLLNWFVVLHVSHFTSTGVPVKFRKD